MKDRRERSPRGSDRRRDSRDRHETRGRRDDHGRRDRSSSRHGDRDRSSKRQRPGREMGKLRSAWPDDDAPSPSKLSDQEGTEVASAAPEKTKRRRLSGFDKDTPDPNAAPPPQLVGASHMSSSASRTGSSGGSDDPLFLANFGLPVVTISIKESCVAKIVGRGGETIKQVEQSTGATVKLDKTMRSTGICVCRIYGPPSAAQKAADIIRLKIASVQPVAQEDLPEGFFTEEFKVAPKLVGMVLGRGGEGLKKIQDDSGASICFNKDELDLDEKGRPRGNSFHIVGTRHSVDKAKAILLSRLDQQYVTTYGADGLDLTIHENIFHQGDITRELRVQQPFVGRVIGKGKGAIKPVCDQTGCRVQLDQTQRESGFSIIRIIGNPDTVEAAYKVLAEQVERAENGGIESNGDWFCSGCGELQSSRNKSCRACGAAQPPEIIAANAARDRVADDEIRVDQTIVGFVIGPGGNTLKQIKDQSGARVFVDQETKDKGYSIFRIGQPGTPQNKLAQDLINRKISECMNMRSNRDAVPAYPMITNTSHFNQGDVESTPVHRVEVVEAVPLGEPVEADAVPIKVVPIGAKVVTVLLEAIFVEALPTLPAEQAMPLSGPGTSSPETAHVEPMPPLQTIQHLQPTAPPIAGVVSPPNLLNSGSVLPPGGVVPLRTSTLDGSLSQSDVGVVPSLAHSTVVLPPPSMLSNGLLPTSTELVPRAALPTNGSPPSVVAGAVPHPNSGANVAWPCGGIESVRSPIGGGITVWPPGAGQVAKSSNCVVVLPPSAAENGQLPRGAGCLPPNPPGVVVLPPGSTRTLPPAPITGAGTVPPPPSTGGVVVLPPGIVDPVPPPMTNRIWPPIQNELQQPNSYGQQSMNVPLAFSQRKAVEEDLLGSAGTFVGVVPISKPPPVQLQ